MHYHVTFEPRHKKTNISYEFLTRYDTHQAVHSQKIIRGLKFRIEEGEELYYLCGETKALNCAFVFAYAIKQNFS